MTKGAYKKKHAKCAMCGSQKDLEVHHILPKSLGGTDEESNYITLCHKHHMEKIHGSNVKEDINHGALTRKGIEKARTSKEPCWEWVKLIDIFQCYLNYYELYDDFPKIDELVDFIKQTCTLRIMRDSDHKGMYGGYKEPAKK